MLRLSDFVTSRKRFYNQSIMKLSLKVTVTQQNGLVEISLRRRCIDSKLQLYNFFVPYN